jgi:tetratricopeptide (TPR) repeat protein
VRAALVRVLDGLSAIHQDQADSAASRADFQEILWVDPSRIPQRVASAMLYKFENQPEEVVRELQITAILSPNDAHVHENLAIAYGAIPKVRSPSRSQFHLRRMLELNPNHPQAKDYQQSLQKVTAMLAVTRARMDMEELTSRAYQLAAEGSINQSIGAFADVFKLDTSNVADFEQVASLYLAKEDYRPAADCLLDAAVLAPERVDLLLQLADVYEEMGDPILALEFARTAARRGSTDSAQVRAALEQLEARLQDAPWVPPGHATPCGPAPELAASGGATPAAQK